MSLIDISGLQAMAALRHKLAGLNVMLEVAALHDEVRRMMERGGLIAGGGSEKFFWRADQPNRRVK